MCSFSLCLCFSVSRDEWGESWGRERWRQQLPPHLCHPECRPSDGLRHHAAPHHLFWTDTAGLAPDSFGPKPALTNVKWNWDFSWFALVKTGLKRREGGQNFFFFPSWKPWSLESFATVRQVHTVYRKHLSCAVVQFPREVDPRQRWWLPSIVNFFPTPASPNSLQPSTEAAFSPWSLWHKRFVWLLCWTWTDVQYSSSHKVFSIPLDWSAILIPALIFFLLLLLPQ